MKPGTKHRIFTIYGQAQTSLTSLVPGIYAAHALVPAQFGVFGLIQFAYIVALGVLRSTFTDVAMVSDSSDVPTRRHLGAVDAVAGSSMLLALVLVPLFVILVDTPWQVLVMTGLGLVVALAQDAVRLVSISVGSGGAAAANSAVWLASTVAVLPVIDIAYRASPWLIAAAWTLAATPALLYGAIVTGWRPKFSRGCWFIADQPRLSAAFLGEWMMGTGAAQAATYILGLIGGLVAVAGIRASQLLLGPMNIAFQGVQHALMRTVLARRESSLPAMSRLLRWLSLGLGGSCLLLGLLLVTAPTTWLAVIIGDQAVVATTYVLPLAVRAAGSGFIAGSALGLRVLRAGRVLVRTRLMSSLLNIGGGTIGYLSTGTALGGLWGLAIGALLAIALWERSFHVVFRMAMRTPQLGDGRQTGDGQAGRC